MNVQNIKQKMEKLKGLPKEIASFLENENFSKNEIQLLPLFFEKKRIKSTEKELTPTLIKAAESLVQKGVLIKKERKNEIEYSLESLESFFAWVRKNSVKKIKKIESKSSAFIDLLRISLGDSIKSKITYYEGIEGIKNSYRHILEHAKKEVCAYYSVVETIQPELQSFFTNEYVPERAKRKIFSRNIAPKTPKTTYFKLRSEKDFMEMRMVSTKIFPLLNSEINLYENFMHCMVFDEHGGFAVIIEESDIARLQKALFEIAWNGCSQVSLPQKSSSNFLSQDAESFWNNIYLTDNLGSILSNIQSRKKKFLPNMKSKWPLAKAEYVMTKDGEKILKIFDLEVMSDFEKPYMKALAKIVTTHGGKILNIGFGLGIIDTYIEDRRNTRSISEHHIIELNSEVFKEAKKWRESQPNKETIFLHKGDWEDILPKLKEAGHVFDGVIYDGYPLEVDEICRDSVRFIYVLLKLKLIREREGILTFYMDSVDGMGESFKKYLQSLGIQKIETTKIDIELPDRDCEYWKSPYFLAPLLTDIHYK